MFKYQISVEGDGDCTLESQWPLSVGDRLWHSGPQGSFNLRVVAIAYPCRRINPVARVAGHVELVEAVRAEVTCEKIIHKLTVEEKEYAKDIQPVSEGN